MDVVGLPAPAGPAPLVEAVDHDEAAAALERIAEGRGLGEGLGPGLDALAGDLGVLGPPGDEAPANAGELPAGLTGPLVEEEAEADGRTTSTSCPGATLKRGGRARSWNVGEGGIANISAMSSTDEARIARPHMLLTIAGRCRHWLDPDQRQIHPWIVCSTGVVQLTCNYTWHHP